jgi:hypothetical protein
VETISAGTSPEEKLGQLSLNWTVQDNTNMRRKNIYKSAFWGHTKHPNIIMTCAQTDMAQRVA